MKPLLCRFLSPIGFGINGSSMGSKILQVVLEPGRSGVAACVPLRDPDLEWTAGVNRTRGVLKSL